MNAPVHELRYDFTVPNEEERAYALARYVALDESFAKLG